LCWARNSFLVVKALNGRCGIMLQKVVCILRSMEGWGNNNVSIGCCSDVFRVFSVFKGWILICFTGWMLNVLKDGEGRHMVAIQVEELDRATGVTERDPARFSIDSAEIERRKQWTASTCRQVCSL
jgi:hypothetical protein